jgi:integrase
VLYAIQAYDQRIPASPGQTNAACRAGRRATTPLPVEPGAARQLWHDEGWVFAKSDGRPAQPEHDYHEWKALIEEAGLPECRLHGARHTAATVLAILTVPTPTAMAIMGWSSAEMAARY